MTTMTATLTTVYNTYHQQQLKCSAELHQYVSRISHCYAAATFNIWNKTLARVGAGLAINRSLVQHPAAALPSSDPG